MKGSGFEMTKSCQIVAWNGMEWRKDQNSSYNPEAESYTKQMFLMLLRQVYFALVMSAQLTWCCC